jgi:hypothetical protein
MWHCRWQAGKRLRQTHFWRTAVIPTPIQALDQPLFSGLSHPDAAALNWFDSIANLS